MGFGNSIEEISIKKIKGGIRGIKNGTKTPQDANINYFLEKLKPLNIEMHCELQRQYINVVNNYNQKKKIVEKF